MIISNEKYLDVGLFVGLGVGEADSLIRIEMVLAKLR
jgi:hypothetical protein